MDPFSIIANIDIVMGVLIVPSLPLNQMGLGQIDSFAAFCSKKCRGSPACHVPAIISSMSTHEYINNTAIVAIIEERRLNEQYRYLVRPYTSYGKALPTWKVPPVP